MPPPATVFSRDHTDARARMPNFTTVDQISKFVDGSIFWRRSKAANSFIIFATTFYTTLVVVLAILILHKIYNRSWWVFRVVPRGHSKLIIPNVHTSWVLFMGLDVCIMIGSFIANFVSYSRAEPVPNTGLWISTQWAPICFAAWYQTWGITAARVNNGSASFHNLPGKSLARYMPSWLVNIVCLCIPGGPCLLAVVPGAIGNTFLERARHGWYDWHRKYNGMPDLTRDMLVDAQNTFHASIHGVYYICISQTIWGVVCIIFGGAYAFAACSLIMDLKAHLEAMRGGLPSHRFRMVVQPQSSRDRSPVGPIGNVGGDDAASNCKLASTRTLESAHSRRCDNGSNEEHQSHIHSHMFTNREQAEDRSGTFFPPVIPSRMVVKLPTSKAEKVLFYITIQSASVILGCFGLLVAIFIMILRSYAAAEENSYETVEAVGYLVVVGVGLVTGAGSFFSVTHTTFEASFAALLHARFEP
ncbi:hypothetical protein CF336_g7680 [Tilletia laevis]|nr:hypothetical protein CF336_g7680 [Tilletia laevis]